MARGDACPHLRRLPCKGTDPSRTPCFAFYPARQCYSCFYRQLCLHPCNRLRTTLSARDRKLVVLLCRCESTSIPMTSILRESPLDTSSKRWLLIDWLMASFGPLKGLCPHSKGLAALALSL